MNLYKVLLSKEDIRTLTEEEKVFFIQAGTVLNEVNILIKLLIISNKESENSVVAKAQHSQTIFFMSLLSGKLWECWIFLHKAYFKSKLAKKYESILSNEGQESLKELKTYFGKDNLIKNIRNKLAFHYDTQEVTDQIPAILLDQIPEIYLAESQGNSLFYISDILRLKTILEYTGNSDAKVAKEALFSEILRIAELFVQFIYHCLVAMIGNHENIELEKVNIGNIPNINDISLPYFVSK